MKGNVEFGGFRDNEEAFRAAVCFVEHATDIESLQCAMSLLVGLRDHILRTAERKSTSGLLLQIEQILKDPVAYAKASKGKPVRRKPSREQEGPAKTPPKTKSPTGIQVLRWLLHWMERLANSFLKQWSFLCLHFLLVLSVLSFNVAINGVLSRFRVEIRSYVGPIVHFTDICLVSVVCAESLIFLTFTVIKEILRQIRSLRPDPGGTNSGGTPSSSSDSALRAFQRTNAARIAVFQKEMISGRFTKDAVEMPNAFAALGQAHSRFDAVSRDELPYWLTDLTNPFAEEYFKAGADLVRKGKNVTRVFLLSEHQIQQREILKEVLLKHLHNGIGFAVVSFEQLPSRVKDRAKELDFALWDRGSAYSVFRQQEGGYSRKMDIAFSYGGANADVRTKVVLYKELLTYAWLVDKVYADCQDDLIRDLVPNVMENNNRLLPLIGGRIKPERQFFINVDGEAELSKKVDNLLALWTLIRNKQRNREAETNEYTCSAQG